MITMCCVRCGQPYNGDRDVDTTKSFAYMYCEECEKKLPTNPVVVEEKPMKHLALCVNTRYGRAGIVVSGESESQLLNWVHTTNRIGYVGCETFEKAVQRAGMMERDEPGAWGPLEEQ